MASRAQALNSFKTRARMLMSIINNQIISKIFWRPITDANRTPPGSRGRTALRTAPSSPFRRVVFSELTHLCQHKQSAHTLRRRIMAQQSTSP